MVSDRPLYGPLFCIFLVFSQLLLFHCCGASKQNDSTEVDLIGKVNVNALPSLRKNAQKASESMMNRILPLLIVPFLISSAIIPLMLGSIKILLVKGFFTGTIAVVLMLISFFRRRAEGGGVYDHYAPELAQEHYGYQGIDEPGLYVHKRRKRRFAKILANNA